MPSEGRGTVSRNWPKLGVLDFVPVAQDESPAYTLGTTVEIAVLADRLGFRRYWIAEHWACGVATPSPEVLTPVIASLTGRILVGPAGILLRLYSPLKVACNALLAETLFPGRTELGLASGGASPDVVRALRTTDAEAAAVGRDADKVAEVLVYLEHRGPVPACPLGAGPPKVWVLGTGGDSASLAARLGTAFALSLFHRPTMPDPAAMDRAYRGAFRPSSDRWIDELGGLVRRFDADEVVVLDLCQRARIAAGRSNSWRAPSSQSVRAPREHANREFAGSCMGARQSSFDPACWLTRVNSAATRPAGVAPPAAVANLWRRARSAGSKAGTYRIDRRADREIR